MECPGCLTKEIKFVDDYKYHIKKDENFLGKMKIYFCKVCDISFAYPAPKINQITYYYNNIYRAKNRPHSYSNITQEIRDIHFSHINLISQYIDIKKIKNVYEIGPGYGQLGELLKLSGVKNIYSEEIDKKLQKYLNKNYVSGINKNINLVIAIHSLEHFSNFDQFFDLFANSLAPNSHILIEVPNNENKLWFKKRPYDSPHLVFFSKNGLENILIKRNYKILFSNYTGIELDDHFKNMNKSKNFFYNWPKINRNYKLFNFFKKILKTILPIFLLDILRKIKNKSKAKSFNFLIDNLIYGSSNRSNIRILAKKI